MTEKPLFPYRARLLIKAFLIAIASAPLLFGSLSKFANAQVHILRDGGIQISLGIDKRAYISVFNDIDESMTFISNNIISKFMGDTDRNFSLSADLISRGSGIIQFRGIKFASGYANIFCHVDNYIIGQCIVDNKILSIGSCSIKLFNKGKIIICEWRSAKGTGIGGAGTLYLSVNKSIEFMGFLPDWEYSQYNGREYYWDSEKKITTGDEIEIKHCIYYSEKPIDNEIDIKRGLGCSLYNLDILGGNIDHKSGLDLRGNYLMEFFPHGNQPE